MVFSYSLHLEIGVKFYFIKIKNNRDETLIWETTK